MLLIVSLIASANVFVYYQASLTVSPIEPPLVFLDPNITGIAPAIGPNQTSAHVVVFGSNIAELVKNPDFYSSADQWYAQPGNYISVYWAVDGSGGSSGGTAEFYGSLPGTLYVLTDVAFVLQPIHTPPATIVSVNMTVRYRLATLTGIAAASYVFGVWDPEGNGGWAWYTTGSLSTSGTYVEQTFTVTNITADKDYIVAGGIVVRTIWTGTTVDYYIDYIQLTIETAEYTFSNTVLSINATAGGPYYAWLALTGIDAQPDLDCNITLLNWTSHRSTPIRIVDGVVVSGETSEVALPVPPSSLYASGSIEVSMVKNSALNSTINMSLTYCTLPGGGGACVTYPITLVIDPPAAGITYNAGRDDVGSAIPAVPRSLLRVDPDEARPILERGGG